MADKDTCLMGVVTYWFREKCFQEMKKALDEGFTKYPNDNILKFFNAVVILHQGKSSESIRELEPLLANKETVICAALAMIQAHKMAANIDKDALQVLDNKVKSERKNNFTAKSFYYAGLYHTLEGRIEKAKEYIDRVLKIDMEDKAKEIYALKGWIDMSMPDVNLAQNSIQFFNSSLSIEGKKCMDGIFGKARYMMAIGDTGEAMELINQAIVSYPKVVCGFIEKMKIHIAMDDWDLAMDASQRALAINKNCLHAKCYNVLHALCKEGNTNEAVSLIQDLNACFNTLESQNTSLMCSFSKVIARLCGKNATILNHTVGLLEKAISEDKENIELLGELGRQMLMQNRIKDAFRCYNNIQQLQQNNADNMIGPLYCYLLENQLEEAASQLEFLKEVGTNIDTSSELLFLSGLLAMKKGESYEKIATFFDQSIDLHLKNCEGIPIGIDYYILLNPDFIMNLVDNYMTFAPQQPLTRNQATHPVLLKCGEILEKLCKLMPAHVQASYTIAKIKFLSGDADVAKQLLEKCLERDSTSSRFHILMAQIHLHLDNFKMADASLEMGLSYNFEVRDHPLYHLIKARILKKEGDLPKAIKMLQTAMLLPGVRPTSRQKGNRKNIAEISTNDRVSVYLELSDAHRRLNEMPEATKVMIDAQNDFKGTPEEVRIAIANADVELSQGDVEAALTILRSVTPDQTYYLQAKEKMAEIYLNHRKDKRLYVSCYKELTEKAPSIQASILLGDAYMNVQEPEHAIEVYEQASKRNARDAVLAKKIGHALVKTHQYTRAVLYYEVSLKQGGPLFLRSDLAKLLIKLKQEEKAEKILNIFLENNDKENSFEVTAHTARCHFLMAEICLNQDRYEEHYNHLNKAKETQNKLLLRSSVDQPENIEDVKSFMAEICCKIASFNILRRAYDDAVKLYREALIHQESNGKIILELTNVLLSMNELEASERQCNQLIADNKEKESALLLLADIMFRRNEYEKATTYMQELLKYKPDHYFGIARILEMLRRVGRLDECPLYLEMARKSSTKVQYHAGYNYCEGLYNWYIGDINASLRYLNRARKDSEFGTEASFKMVEICLNPDGDTIAGTLLDSSEVDPRNMAQKSEIEKAGLYTADKLLKDVKPRRGDLRHIFLSNIMYMLTRNQTNVETALQNFMHILKLDPDNIAALHGSAVALLLLKQDAKARSQLKRVTRTLWNIKDAENLERCWLLAADLALQKGENDVAIEMLDKCIANNKSCCKAYEYYGYMNEKLGKHLEAVKSYQQAWKLTGQKNPNIGYKLAINYFKCKSYTDAIDTARQVLLVYPNYPKIQKEILDKSQSLIMMTS